MGDSLRDQLVKAGLVSEERARQAEQPRRARKRASDKRPRKPKAARPAQPAPPRAEQPKSPRQQAREEGRARRLLDGRLQAILTEAAQNDAHAEIAHHFTRGSKIKHLYVTQAQQDALAAGELAIVGFHGRHYVVAWHDARRMRDIDPKLFVFRHDPDGSETEANAS